MEPTENLVRIVLKHSKDTNTEHVIRFSNPIDDTTIQEFTETLVATKYANPHLYDQPEAVVTEAINTFNARRLHNPKSQWATHYTTVYKATIEI